MPDIDPEAWYIYDHVDEVVVEKDLDEQEAEELVREYSARYIAASGGALLEFAAETTISWDCGDVRKVTDGGRIHEDSADDDTPLIAAGVNTDEQVELTIIGDPSHSINLNIDKARQLHYALGHALEAVSDGGDAQ